MNDWHLFDEERGYEVSEVETPSGERTFLVRDRSGKTTELTHEEFNQLRAEGKNPKDLR